MSHFLPELCCRNQSFKQLMEYNFNFKISRGVSSIAQSSPPMKVSCNFLAKGGHNEADVVKQLVVPQAGVLRFETKSIRRSAIFNFYLETVRNSFFPLDILLGRHNDYIDFVHHISIMFKIAPSPNFPSFYSEKFFSQRAFPVSL